MNRIKLDIDFCKTTLISNESISLQEIITETNNKTVKSDKGLVSFINLNNEIVFKTYIENLNQSLFYFFERFKNTLSYHRHNYRDLDIDSILDMFNIKYIEIII